MGPVSQRKLIGTVLIVLCMLMFVVSRVDASPWPDAERVYTLCSTPQPAPVLPDILSINLQLIIDQRLPVSYVHGLAWSMRMMRSELIGFSLCVEREVIRLADPTYGETW